MDNTVAYGAAKTRALTHRLGGKERFKHVGQYIEYRLETDMLRKCSSVETMGDRPCHRYCYDRIASRALLIKLMRTCSIGCHCRSKRLFTLQSVGQHF